jgi:hypothetical protein
MPRPKKIVNENVETTESKMDDVLTTTEQAAEPEVETKAETQVDTSNEEKEQEVPTVDVAALLAKMEAMQKEMEALKTQRTASSYDGTVKMVYINPVSERNEVQLGDFGVLRGSTGFIEIPKRDFGGKFMTSTVQYLLRTRRLIVTDGLTDDEKTRYKLDYPDDEVMTDQAFNHLLSMKTEALVEMFSKLCKTHQQFVARRFITAYEEGDNRINREKVEKLNNISKKNDPEGMFKPILMAMNKV